MLILVGVLGLVFGIEQVDEEVRLREGQEYAFPLGEWQTLQTFDKRKESEVLFNAVKVDGKIIVYYAKERFEVKENRFTIADISRQDEESG